MTRMGEETAYVYDLCGNRLKKLDYLRAGMVENEVGKEFLYYNGELLAESDPLGNVVSRYILGYGV